MRGVVYAKQDKVHSIKQQTNEIHVFHENPFFETAKSEVIISLFETLKLLVSISPRDRYRPLPLKILINNIKIKNNITCKQYDNRASSLTT